jgi:hypothetical protein
MVLEYNNNKRTRYLIYLTPDNFLTSKIDLIRKNIELTGLNSEVSLLGNHLTSLGFYSEFETLDFESVNTLESSVISVFESLNDKNNLGNIIENINSSKTKIKHHDIYGKTLVLTLENSNLNLFHNSIIDTFESLIVLKGSIPATSDQFYFGQRYPFAKRKYSPHISICELSDASDSTKLDLYNLSSLRNISKQEFYFSKLVLSKKELNQWRNLSSINLKIKSY